MQVSNRSAWFSMIAVVALTGTVRADENSAVQERQLVPSITVVGSGKSFAKPDLAQIQVGVVTQDESAAEALQANNRAMNGLIETLKNRQIAERDIQTTSFTVSPRYHHDQRGRQVPEIVGYEVRNLVQIRVRDIEKLGELLDEVIGEGANQVHGINFSVDDAEKILDEARLKALTDARRKAELYANAAGIELGRVLLIQEQPPALPMQPRMFEMARQMADAAVPIAPGEQEFQVRITVTYAVD